MGLKKKHSATVRKFYLQWRAECGLPECCDNPDCHFHTAPLEWNGKSLSLILDHKSGNHCDDSRENLQLLCPICDSQLATRGGRNKGRIQAKSPSGYAIQHSPERRDARAFINSEQHSTAQLAMAVVRADGTLDDKETA